MAGTPQAAGEVPWPYDLAATADGGQDWARVSLPTPTRLTPFYSPNLSVLPVVPRADAPMVGVVYDEAAGAAELVVCRESPPNFWRVQGTLRAAAPSRGLNLAMVSFGSAQDWRAVLHGGLYRTTDGGQRWRLKYKNPQVTGRATLQFTASQAGRALDASGHLWDTVDRSHV